MGNLGFPNGQCQKGNLLSILEIFPFVRLPHGTLTKKVVSTNIVVLGIGNRLAPLIQPVQCGELLVNRKFLSCSTTFVLPWKQRLHLFSIIPYPMLR